VFALQIRFISKTYTIRSLLCCVVQW
jgi:hypothetical protein